MVTVMYVKLIIAMIEMKNCAEVYTSCQNFSNCPFIFIHLKGDLLGKDAQDKHTHF